jgi:hypothetical protein
MWDDSSFSIHTKTRRGRQGDKKEAAAVVVGAAAWVNRRPTKVLYESKQRFRNGKTYGDIFVRHRGKEERARHGRSSLAPTLSVNPLSAWMRLAQKLDTHVNREPASF